MAQSPSSGSSSDSGLSQDELALQSLLSLLGGTSGQAAAADGDDRAEEADQRTETPVLSETSVTQSISSPESPAPSALTSPSDPEPPTDPVIESWPTPESDPEFWSSGQSQSLQVAPDRASQQADENPFQFSSTALSGSRPVSSSLDDSRSRAEQEVSTPQSSGDRPSRLNSESLLSSTSPLSQPSQSLSAPPPQQPTSGQSTTFSAQQFDAPQQSDTPQKDTSRQDVNSQADEAGAGDFLAGLMALSGGGGGEDGDGDEFDQLQDLLVSPGMKKMQREAAALKKDLGQLEKKVETIRQNVASVEDQLYVPEDIVQLLMPELTNYIDQRLDTLKQEMKTEIVEAIAPLLHQLLADQAEQAKHLSIQVVGLRKDA